MNEERREAGKHLSKVVQSAAVVVDEVVRLQQVALVAVFAQVARAVRKEVDAAHLQSRVSPRLRSLPV